MSNTVLAAAHEMEREMIRSQADLAASIAALRRMKERSKAARVPHSRNTLDRVSVPGGGYGGLGSSDPFYDPNVDTGSSAGGVPGQPVPPLGGHR